MGLVSLEAFPSERSIVNIVIIYLNELVEVVKHNYIHHIINVFLHDVGTRSRRLRGRTISARNCVQALRITTPVTHPLTDFVCTLDLVDRRSETPRVEQRHHRWHWLHGLHWLEN